MNELRLDLRALAAAPNARARRERTARNRHGTFFIGKTSLCVGRNTTLMGRPAPLSGPLGHGVGADRDGRSEEEKR